MRIRSMVIGALLALIACLWLPGCMVLIAKDGGTNNVTNTAGIKWHTHSPTGSGQYKGSRDNNNFRD